MENLHCSQSSQSVVHYEVQRFVSYDDDGTVSVSYCVFCEGRELQFLHYCSIFKLLAFFSDVETDIVEGLEEVS